MYLYVLDFTNFFKIGITKHLHRIKHLENVYLNNTLSLKHSYLVTFKKERTARFFERLLLNKFENFKHHFNGERLEGDTECLMKECFNDVLSYLQMLIQHHNNLFDEKITIKKGIQFIKNNKTKKIQKPKLSKKVEEKTSGIKTKEKEILFQSFKKYKNHFKGIYFQEKYKCFSLVFEECVDMDSILKEFPRIYYEQKEFFGFINLTCGISVSNNDFEVHFFIIDDMNHFDEIKTFYKEIFEFFQLDFKHLEEMTNKHPI